MTASKLRRQNIFPTYPRPWALSSTHEQRHHMHILLLSWTLPHRKPKCLCPVCSQRLFTGDIKYFPFPQPRRRWLNRWSGPPKPPRLVVQPVLADLVRAIHRKRVLRAMYSGRGMAVTAFDTPVDAESSCRVERAQPLFWKGGAVAAASMVLGACVW